MDKVKRIEKPGTYNVQIIEPRWEALEPKPGDSNRMVAILPGHTWEGEIIEARLMFVSTIVSGGQNKGKPTWQVSADKLHELGMPKPFNPADLSKLNDVECEYVVEMEQYEGKTRPTVRFINTKRREALQPDQASAIWANLTGGAAPAMAPVQRPAQAAAAPAEVAKVEDDLPWD